MNERQRNHAVFSLSNSESTVHKTTKTAFSILLFSLTTLLSNLNIAKNFTIFMNSGLISGKKYLPKCYIYWSLNSVWVKGLMPLNSL